MVVIDVQHFLLPYLLPVGYFIFAVFDTGSGCAAQAGFEASFLIGVCPSDQLICEPFY